MKMLGVALASCLLLASVSQPALADGDRGTRDEQQSFAGREERTPVLAEFQGGCMSEELMWFFLITAPLWIALLPVGLLVWGLATLCEKKDPPPSKLPPPEQEGQGYRRSSGPPLTATRAPSGARR
jgi:hypothetical protein